MLEYDVSLDVDVDASTFQGTIRISGVVAPSPIELDAVDLRIDAVRQGATPVPFRLDAPRGKLRIDLDSADPAPVEVDFAGTAVDGAQTGLFVSHLGPSKALSTMMEPESCRRLIPCFDRPDAKAVFRLAVTAGPAFVVISNMPGEAALAPDGRRRWTFLPTPPMAPYLLFIGVGTFEETAAPDAAPRVIVAAPPGSAHRTAGSLHVARETLRALGAYFDLPYPLPKLHLVALSDYWVAMENWGAIAGGDDLFLYDEATEPSGVQWADQTIVHEIAHQWFGNLVTLRTWEDLWLNESFATFITPRIQERAGLRPDPWGEFVLFTARGDPADSVPSAHPVRPTQVGASEIMSAADHITYFKGSRLIRMVEAYLGVEDFRRGLSRYLRDHQFGNATSADLWRALEETSGRGVVELMRAWVERPGHPCISVAQAGTDVVLTQRRFSYLPADGDEPPWPIPLPLEDAGGRRVLLFDRPSMTLVRSDTRTLRLDPGRAGFYRLLYERPLRSQLLADLGRLPPLDRWAFLHDARSFLLSGDYSLDEYAAAIGSAYDATDLVTVAEVTQSAFLFGPSISDVPRYRDTMREFCRAQSARLGERRVPGEPSSNDLLREWVARIRVSVDETYARELAPRFEKLDLEPPALRSAITSAYARCASPGQLERVIAQMSDADSDRASRACLALWQFSDPGSVTRALDAALASVRLGDLFVFVLFSAARNPVGRAPLWVWLTAHLRELERRAQGTYLLALTLDFVIPLLGIDRPEEVRAFFARESFPEGERGIVSGLEMLEVVRRMRARIATADPSR